MVGVGGGGYSRSRAHEDDRLADGHVRDGGEVTVVLLVLVLAADDPHCGCEGRGGGGARGRSREMRSRVHGLVALHCELFDV